MYLGIQNGKIVFVSNSKYELENLPCVELDEIKYTPDTYKLVNGSYYAKEEDIDPNNEVINNRIVAYPSIQDQLDMIYWDKINGTNKWEEEITKIKTTYPKVETKKETKKETTDTTNKK